MPAAPQTHADEIPAHALSALLEALPAAAIAIEPSGRVRFANQRAMRLLGYDDAELHALEGDALVPPELRTRYRELRQVCFERGSPPEAGARTDFAFMTKDGHPLRTGAEFGRLRTSEGALGLVLLATPSLAPRSEEKFARIVDMSPLAIGVTELATGRVLEVNDAFERTFRVTRERALGRTLIELGFWQNAADRVRMIELVKQHGAVRDYEVQGRTLTGEPLVLLLSSEPITLGDTPCLVTFAHDVTLQRRAESGLRASEEKFAKAFHITPYSVSIVDLETDRYIDVNEGFERLFECKRDQIVGRRVGEVGLWSDPEQRMRLLAAVRKHGLVRDQPALGQTLDGKPRYGNMSAQIIEISGRDCLLTFARDMTEQVEAERVKGELEAQLRDAQKLEALGTLAGGIAHDFNNILGAIVAYTDLIHMEHADAAAVKEYVGELQHASNRARDLVLQILTFSRRQKHERRPARIDIAVREALKLLRSTLPATIEIDSHIDQEAPIVLADLSQIHQIVMNLGTNAAHAMRDRPGRLSVRLESVDVSDVTARSRTDLRPGRNARLTVGDTGSGMDAYTRKRIFEPFFTTKAPGEGTGLGLAVVHGIVREHEGSIAVESRLGQGTIFELHFPEHPNELSDDVELASTLERGQGEHVLLVDDEPALRHSISRLLERLGYKVTTLASPAEALQVFCGDKRAFDLVLTDLSMPGMTGVDMAKEMLAARPDVPIVVMSGFTATWTPEALQAMGVRSLISKPISAALLASTVRETLDQPAPRPPVG
jgi:PAS domain S-box-containing protein